jgi:CubicO group peptidase (beta-lactamase class C family)
MRRYLTLLGLALLFLVSVSVAQRPVTEQPKVIQALELLRVWLEAEQAYDRLPGLSAAVVADQQMIWSRAFGYSDLATKVPATPSTIYSICSISKLFTSVAVMQQRDAGKLRLDDPVGRFLPWFNAIRRTTPESGEITVEGLLTHASGLPRESNQPYWTGPDFPFPTREQIIEGLAKQETLYPAETWFQYSNLGLTLAGEVVAATSGLPYADYVRKNIIAPLGLASTAPELPDAERGKRLATGYGSLTRDGVRQPVAPFQARGIAPAAGYSSTVEDLSKFAAWQFRLLGKGGTEVLNANTLREMHRVHWVDPDFEVTWGLGFHVWRNNEKTFVGHDGSCPGYRTALLLQDGERIATVFMTNAMVNSNAYSQQMHNIVGPALVAAARDSATPTPADAALAKYTGTYGAQPWGGETAIVTWEDGLAALGLPTMTPMADLTKLRKVGEHTFRRVRKDGALGETWTFEIGPDGKASRYQVHQNWRSRIR